METGTFMYATAILGGDVIIKNARSNHMEIVSKKLMQAGVHVLPFADSINVKSYGTKRNVNIATAPHPGFPTDLQAPAMVLATVSMGSCTIKEHIFENRLNHANELIRLGAKIKVDKQYATVSGGDKLSGAEVEACDLRAGAALVLAGLAAEGTTIIHDAGHIKRGYDGFGVKLSALGAELTLLPDN
jgi:UDP-N-acetylglucosamine 1-carboxyvinyltransferase